jgi:hypothetical protein
MSTLIEKLHAQQEADEQASIRNEAVYGDLISGLAEAERKAWDALARYKFQMFGYWAAIWVHLNRIGGFKRPNPFKPVVMQARICNVPNEKS